MRISATLRQQVRERAAGRCEYCLIHDEDVFLPHEPDHVVATKHGGATVLDNLAWACRVCNRYKGTDLASLDPATGRVIMLFNPRGQRWNRHFRHNGTRIEPLTACARATVRLLRLNDPRRILERATVIALGRYPTQ
jgi:HNH endonuclease